MLLFCAFCAFLVSCSGNGWTQDEKSLIVGSPEVMRVLSVDDSADLAVLRRQSSDISAVCLKSTECKTLARKLIATVTDPSQDGVGIAAPQVGISRRVVAVQRFDKEGEPFEVYPNIRITQMRGELVTGGEGCLSVPLRYGQVLRSRDIDITYTSLCSLEDTTETITGFTAVIFQHECDHLDGVIYTDRIWSYGDSWFGGPADADSSLVDVFYVVSTNVLKSVDSEGNEVFNAALDEDERAAYASEMGYARGRMFGESFNFFSPYYHQVTMNGFYLDSATLDKSYRRASLEVADAFDYYMKHFNDGRRFILAGFSQGSMIVRDLLKKMDEEQYSRLVAAYMIGFGLDADEIGHPHIRPACGSEDEGVAICFNSVADTAGIFDLVYNNSATCINPVNWCTDATPAQFSFEGQNLTASIDTVKNVLVVKGYKPQSNVFAAFFPKGCLHHEDILFYTPFIRDNAMKRSY